MDVCFHLYLYLSDNWNLENTRDLLNSIPQYSGKVTNSPIYRDTRQDKVKERLRAAHTRFINEKMQRSEEEAKNYNYNSARYQDYSDLGKYLYQCFDVYKSLWGWTRECEQWKITVKDWEKYIYPQTEN
jgi:outer membrane cobalamin receptor